jgi:hypothetical protein
MSETQGTAPTQGASQALARSAAEVGTMHENAKSGRLSLDPSAGEAIRSMLAEQMTKVDTWIKQAGNLARHAPLGQNPVGQAMAAKFAQRAESKDDSFAGVLTRYRQILSDAHDAISDAMRQYRQNDDSAAESLRKLAR